MDAAVFGEGAILGFFEVAPVKVPTFFILPGVIFMIVLSLLFESGTPDDKKRIPSGFTKPEFWIWAIFLSLALAILIYPETTAALSKSGFAPEIFNRKRDYLEEYDLKDIAMAWGISLFAAVLCFIAVKMSVRLWQSLTSAWQRTWNRVAAWRQDRRTVNSEDSPLEMLRKLERRGRPNQLPVVTFLDAGGSTREVLLLHPLDDNNSMVGPKVIVTRIDTVNQNKEWSEVAIELVARPNLTNLIQQLERGEKSKLLKLSFPNIGLTRPESRSSTSLTPRAVDEIVVEMA